MIQPRPRVWPVFVIYGITLFAVLLVSMIVITVVAVLQHGGKLTPELIQQTASSPAGLLGSLLATMVVIAAAAGSGALLSPIPWRQRLRLGRSPVTIASLTVACLGALGIGFIMQALTNLSFLPESPALIQIDRLIQSLSPAGLFAAVAIIGFLPGIAEELLFRGYIQTRLSRRWGCRWSIFLTALMFGIMHLDLLHGCFAFAIGLYVGVATEWTGSIRPAMVIHATNNIVSTLLSAAGFEIEGVVASLVLLLAGTAMVGAGWWAIRRYRTAPAAVTPGAIPCRANL